MLEDLRGVEEGSQGGGDERYERGGTQDLKYQIAKTMACHFQDARSHVLCHQDAWYTSPADSFIDYSQPRAVPSARHIHSSTAKGSNFLRREALIPSPVVAFSGAFDCLPQATANVVCVRLH
jgi:hypothetical protein